MKNLAILALHLALVGCATRGLPATNGVVNFDKVNDALYRGAQPDLEGMRQLKALGIKSVINLRLTNDVWAPEPVVARAYEMAYTNIPLSGLLAPTDAQLKSILAAVETLPQPVFVHCQYGCDRTGTIIACYRIRHDRWSNAQALKEADLHGLSPLSIEMRKLIGQFKP